MNVGSHMKRFSISPVIGKLQIQTRDHYTLLECLKSKRVTALNAGECVEQQELSFFAGDDAKWHSHLGRQFDRFF